MSEREVRRVEVLNEVHSGRRTVTAAASLLGISERQVNRLMVRYRDGGGGALIHQARGRRSNNRLEAGVREYALELVCRNYRDFGPTLAAEALVERRGIKVGRETVRKWMVADGLWLSRKQRRTFHQPRLRRESYGELIQIDRSEHRWFDKGLLSRNGGRSVRTIGGPMEADDYPPAVWAGRCRYTGQTLLGSGASYSDCVTEDADSVAAMS